MAMNESCHGTSAQLVRMEVAMCCRVHLEAQFQVPMTQQRQQAALDYSHHIPALQSLLAGNDSEPHVAANFPSAAGAPAVATDTLASMSFYSGKPLTEGRMESSMHEPSVAPHLVTSGASLSATPGDIFPDAYASTMYNAGTLGTGHHRVSTGGVLRHNNGAMPDYFNREQLV